MKQPQLFRAPKLSHGGSVNSGHRKVARPLCSKRPVHLVLRSSRAQGKWHFFRPQNRRRIAEILDRTAGENQVRVLGFQNVGNHLHLVVLGKSRALLRDFLRLFPQRVSMAITGAKKGNPQGRFFDSLLFSRVLGWGRELREIKRYLFKNALEALGYHPAEVQFLKAEAARLTPPEVNERGRRCRPDRGPRLFS